jgi:hypothetical protein
MLGNNCWWAALEIQRARELEWKMKHRWPMPKSPKVTRKLMQLVRKAKRQGLSPAEIEGIVRWALNHE